jgi:membrane associated rhomboid family serine protease/Flp pilus assembly protein TadD
MRRRPLFTRPDLQEPPPSPPGSLEPGPGWPPGSRPPAFQRPLVTYALIAVNVAIWLLVGLLGSGSLLLQLANPDANTLVLLGGKFGPLIHAGQYWRLVTAMFLHAGILHLAVNMWALLQLGMFCELLYGRARFLILYVCTGVIGNIASYLMAPTLGVGASGALFGLFGVALVFSIKYRRELPRGMGDRMLRSLVPVLLLNLAITFTLPFIDKYAHLAGLISGAILAVFTESRTASPERRARESLPVPLALLTALGLLAYGAWGLATAVPLAVKYHTAAVAKRPADADAAIRALQQAAARHPNDIGLQLELLSLLEQRQRWPEATQAFLALSPSRLSPEELYTEGFPLAITLDQLRRGSEAEAVYRRLLERDPDNPALLNGLAYLYADVLDTHLNEAEQMARKALEADSHNGGIMDTLAWIYFKEGDLNGAYTTQQQALRLPGEQAEILHFHMGAIDEARGDLTAAQKEYETALRLDPSQAEARRALEKLRRRPPGPALPPR